MDVTRKPCKTTSSTETARNPWPTWELDRRKGGSYADAEADKGSYAETVYSIVSRQHEK